MTAATAAAVAATLRVLQLASSGSQPAVPAEASRQVLQEIKRAAGQSDKGASGVLLTCMAEAVALQQIVSEQVSKNFSIDPSVACKIESFLGCMQPYSTLGFCVCFCGS